MVTAAEDTNRLLMLMTLLSPAFPTGAFAYSHGLEQAIVEGAIAEADSLYSWIGSLVEKGSAFNDAVLIARMTPENLEALNSLALSLSASRERFLESTALGENFATSARCFLAIDTPEGDISYPMAVAAAGHAAGIEKRALIAAYLHGFSANLVSAAIRLIPIGQRAGLTVLARLLPAIASTTERALAAGLDDLGNACFFSDMAAMRHELQQPRIFRT